MNPNGCVCESDLTSSEKQCKMLCNMSQDFWKRDDWTEMHLIRKPVWNVKASKAAQPFKWIGLRKGFCLCKVKTLANSKTQHEFKCCLADVPKRWAKHWMKWRGIGSLCLMKCKWSQKKKWETMLHWTMSWLGVGKSVSPKMLPKTSQQLLQGQKTLKSLLSWQIANHQLTVKCAWWICNSPVSVKIADFLVREPWSMCKAPFSIHTEMCSSCLVSLRIQCHIVSGLVCLSRFWVSKTHSCKMGNGLFIVSQLMWMSVKRCFMKTLTSASAWVCGWWNVQNVWTQGTCFLVNALCDLLCLICWTLFPLPFWFVTQERRMVVSLDLIPVLSQPTFPFKMHSFCSGAGCSQWLGGILLSKILLHSMNWTIHWQPLFAVCLWPNEVTDNAPIVMRASVWLLQLSGLERMHPHANHFPVLSELKFDSSFAVCLRKFTEDSQELSKNWNLKKGLGWCMQDADLPIRTNPVFRFCLIFEPPPPVRKRIRKSIPIQLCTNSDGVLVFHRRDTLIPATGSCSSGPSNGSREITTVYRWLPWLVLAKQQEWLHGSTMVSQWFHLWRVE